MESLSVHHENICTSLFQTVVAEENHKLRSLLPPTHTSFYDYDVTLIVFKLVFLWLRAANHLPNVIEMT